jgi:hypothetical protein
MKFKCILNCHFDPPALENVRIAKAEGILETGSTTVMHVNQRNDDR